MKNVLRSVSLWIMPVEASLFLTPIEKEKALHTQGISTKKWDIKSFPLKIEAIFRRPDLGQWTVWINGHRIDSQSPQSIEGWSVVDVGFDTVIVRSVYGEQVILRLESPFQKSNISEKNDVIGVKEDEKEAHIVKTNTVRPSVEEPIHPLQKEEAFSADDIPEKPSDPQEGQS